jgi:hypothetical protein
MGKRTVHTGFGGGNSKRETRQRTGCRRKNNIKIAVKEIGFEVWA